MQQESSATPVYWSSPTLFVLAAAGAAIGLGNIWRLPYLAGEYGGGAFVLVYLLALAGMGLPLLVAELLLGRGARGDLARMLRQWARASRLHGVWSAVGYLALLGAVLVLSYYSVIAGWSMAYLLRSAAGELDGAGAEGLRGMFLELVGDPEKGLAWHTLFIVMAAVCVGHGVRRGLEPVARWLLSGALVCLALLVTVAAATEGTGTALRHLFQPDFAALGWRGALEALHQAFFSLSLGVGVMLAFGAYLREDTSLLRVGAAVVFLDILFALAAGFTVVALLAPAGQAPVSGLKLVFEAVPAAMATAGGGVSTLFFFMLLLVSLTSAVGLMEPVVVWAMARFEASRAAAATGVGAVIWFLGLGTLLSFNLMADFTLLDGTVFDWLSLLSSRLLLPLVGLLLCLFAGRFLHPDRLRAAWSDDGGGRAFAVWHWMLRYPARIGLILVLLYAVDVFSFMENLW